MSKTVNQIINSQFVGKKLAVYSIEETISLKLENGNLKTINITNTKTAHLIHRDFDDGHYVYRTKLLNTEYLEISEIYISTDAVNCVCYDSKTQAKAIISLNQHKPIILV